MISKKFFFFPINGVYNIRAQYLTRAPFKGIKTWRRFCSVEFDPESENPRKESKTTVPERIIEPAATSISI